ncbi:MAG: GNAT family N-acetyltransferase [Fibrobacterota bacterium]|nr:GNAT family N-acetyltransferase [Fibrobacterota bacterium]
MALYVKIADLPGEFEQIFRLNYQTFVEEIPQHSRNQDERLVDKFHAENLYLICLDDGELMGMVALRDRRPFSLDSKLPDLDSHLPKNARVMEIRLLAVRPERRHSAVFGLLMKKLLARCLEMDYDVGVISGRLENIPLYEKFGFRPFGPKVGSPGAWYQPMRIDRATLNRGLAVLPKSPESDVAPIMTLNLLPGPVAHSSLVKKALAAEVRSHRSQKYAELLCKTKTMLLQATRAGGVEILMGTGTLANDVIAGQLSLREGRGLILSNGEFGDRLIRHAAGFRLRHLAHHEEWERRFNLDRIAGTLDANPDIKWVWAVHCETSTGRLNPIRELSELCESRGASLCLDCISSLAVVPVDLSGIDLASAVSGKGLGAFTGMAMVFYRNAPSPAPAGLPSYLDLGKYAASGGIPFSGSSNLLSALEASLSEKCEGESARRLAEDSLWLRSRLEAAGISILLDAEESSPAIFTLPLPSGVTSLETGKRLEEMGILLNYNSDYLADRNWIQICLMADQRRSELQTLIMELVRLGAVQPAALRIQSRLPISIKIAAEIGR